MTLSSKKIKSVYRLLTCNMMVGLLLLHLIVFTLMPWTLMAKHQEQPLNNHLQQDQQRRRLMSDATPPSSYQQFVVNSFLNPPELQQDLILHIRASPLELSTQDLIDIETEFQNAYNRQQIEACGGTLFNFLPTYVTSSKILDNKEINGAIDGLGDEPRTIARTVDFSFIMRVNYTCVGCLVNSIDLTLFNEDTNIINDPSLLPYDPRSSYQVPFPSSLSSPSSPCLPFQAAVLNDFESSGFISTIDALEYVYSIDPIPTSHCGDDDDDENNDSAFTPFSSYFTIAVNGDYDIPDLQIQLAMVDHAIVEVYNELNILNPHTCDVHSRIAKSSNVTVVDPKTAQVITQQRRHRRLNDGKYQYTWFFMYAELDGECIGCPQNSCLTNDVSGYETCSASRRRRSLQELDPNAYNNITNNNNGSSCYCVGQNINATLPTNEEFLEALQERFDIMKNETSFSLITDIIYLIEVDVPDSCCGWPINGNIPVDVTGGDFQTAVTSYLDTGSSPYGYPINCWDVSSVEDMSFAFETQTDFNEPLSCWDTSMVTNMNYMFNDAANFNQDVSNFDTNLVTRMSGMFSGAASFNGDISNWDTSRVTRMESMFSQASNFDQNLTQWNTGKVTSMTFMFRRATIFNGDISNWDTSQVSSMVEMFGSTNIFNVDISSWNVSKVTNMAFMFHGALKFNQDLSQWMVTSQMTNLNSMFWDATNFNGDLSTWDTSQVTTMSGVFNGASNFNGNISTWVTSRVTNMTEMFESASFFNIDLSSWDTSSVTDMSGMFASASIFNIDISAWNVNQVTDMGNMFNGATQFRQNLCPWGLIAANLDYIISTNIFPGTNCMTTADPEAISNTWCFAC